MKLSKPIINIHILLGCLLILAFITMSFSLMKIKTVSTLTDKKAQIELNRRLCLEQSQLLSNTSDYLTTQMWHFVATEKPIYLENYWNEVDKTQGRDKAIQKLSTLNLTNEEESLIKSAKQKSDELILKEAWTLGLISESIGITPKKITSIVLTDSENQLTPNKKRDLAIEYVFGEDYTVLKNDIKDNLNKFSTILNVRKDNELSKAISDIQHSLTMAQIYNVAILALLLLSFIIFYAFVVKPFNNYFKCLNNLDGSNLSPLKPSGSKKMKSFAIIFNNVYSSWYKQTEHLKKISLLDSLTKLPNRESLDIYINDALNRGSENLGLLMIDIDHFKSFNDNYGHLMGDKILIEIGTCLSEAVPKELGIAGRLSGEEFIVILPNTTPTQIDTIANNILNKVRNINIKNTGLSLTDNHITVSIGSTLWDSNKKCTSKDLIHRADLALYQAKHNGRNQHIMFSENDYSFILLENSHAHNVEVEADMNRALENKEFIPFYQPKYDVNSGNIVSSEALVRWLHPEKGILYPDYFIPIFEHNGFITKVDLCVFENVCQTIRKWLDEGKYVVPIACNFSRLHFKTPYLALKLKEIVDRYNVPTSYLEIEVTENVLIDNNDIIINELNKLQKMGFTIAIDDFGVGYSSLGALQQLPVDVIKIDKSFLQRNLNDPKNIMIINGILYIAKVLKLDTVCEGVESIEQLNLLKKVGCHLAQGYYYSKPVNQSKFEEILLNNRTASRKIGFETFYIYDGPKLVETILENFYSSHNIDKISNYITDKIQWKDPYCNSTLNNKDMLLEYYKSNILGHSFIIDIKHFLSYKKGKDTVAISGEGNIFESPNANIKGTHFCFNAECILVNSTLKLNKMCIIEIIGEVIDQSNHKESESINETIVCEKQSVIEECYSSVPLGIVRYNATDDMVITYINQYMLDIIGYTCEQLKSEINNNFRMLVYPDDLELIYKKAYEFMDNPQTTPLCYRLIRRDRTIVTVYYTQCNVIGANGKLEIQSMYFDVEKLNNITDMQIY